MELRVTGRQTTPRLSSALSPKEVVVAKGKYLISKPIAAYYYSSIVGNPKDLPVLIASDNFNNGSDGSVLDANPYTPEGNNWYINQNNFFRSIRNFVIDTRQAPHNATVRGVHWQRKDLASDYPNESSDRDVQAIRH
ncbi:hypothetical protein BN14_07630 [Rhizoctonia solani AG-1 IB]|uniref:Rhamnogalacturonase A/B/Epimerase-like pectate lyase domain-containing protein n=1 Tax=Thanatephorus cucumeris (strain AG1-IB / isolate 7/3/14) TaxID=1108050 RepID=M5CCG0_THACB|nr:hypothetical protein BN14_07630 [Rhizoctonia solani AG-1 IB]